MDGDKSRRENTENPTIPAVETQSSGESQFTTTAQRARRKPIQSFFLRRVRRAVVVPFVHDPWSNGCRKSPHAIPQNEPPGLPLSSIRPYGGADLGALTDRGSATQRVDKIVHGVAWHPTLI
jgi:hypothetical protein